MRSNSSRSCRACWSINSRSPCWTMMWVLRPRPAPSGCGGRGHLRGVPIGFLRYLAGSRLRLNNRLSSALQRARRLRRGGITEMARLRAWRPHMTQAAASGRGGPFRARRRAGRSNRGAAGGAVSSLADSGLWGLGHGLLAGERTSHLLGWTLASRCHRQGQGQRRGSVGHHPVAGLSSAGEQRRAHAFKVLVAAPAACRTPT